MIKVFFTKYHNDSNMPKFVKEFDDLDALTDYIFGSMRVPLKRHMYFSEQKISFMPDGWPVEGGYWDYWINEIQNEHGGILYRRCEHCSKVVADWMAKCEKRVNQPEVFVA